MANSHYDLENTIDRLQEIEGNPKLKLAHDTWQTRVAEFNQRIGSHDKQERDLTNEIYQLLGFDSAFQGLLLTAVAQAGQLKCHNVAIPLALSLFATVVTLAGVWQKKGVITKLGSALLTERPARTVWTASLSTNFIFLFLLSVLYFLQLSLF